MWENINYDEDESDSGNWAIGASHPLGLVLDQQTFTAIQHISIHDSDITMNGRQIWLPLELILEGHLL